MAHANTVMRSIETPCASRCVDLCRRPDGSWGFDEQRRDAEDGCGWFPIGGFAQRRFPGRDAAQAAAEAAIPWLRETPPSGPPP
jgi:hypothetical protein